MFLLSRRTAKFSETLRKNIIFLIDMALLLCYNKYNKTKGVFNMYMWVVKEDNRKAIDWFNYDGSFSPLAVLLSKGENGEIEIITTTTNIQNQLKKFAADQELKRFFPDIIEKEFRRYKSIRVAFAKAISMNYLVASDECFNEAMREYIIQFYGVENNISGFFNFFDTEYFTEDFLEQQKGLYYDFVDCKVFPDEQNMEGKRFFNILETIKE